MSNLTPTPYDLSTRLEEKHPIMSFTIDANDRYIAVNLMNQGVHLWDYKLKTLLRMFPGVCQRNFTIYSSFSSPDATFLASGSEGKFQFDAPRFDAPSVTESSWQLNALTNSSVE